MISVEDVRRLLQTEDNDAVLVFIEGRAEVISGPTLDSEDYLGALQVISREELLERLGEQPSEHEVAEQAAILDAAVSELGG